MADPHHHDSDHTHGGRGHPTHDEAHDHGDGAHSHAHGNKWPSKLGHALGSLFGTHSHDHTQSVDQAMSDDRRGMRALVISFSVLMVTAVIQAGLVLVTGSVALWADTVHNFSDAITAVPLFIAFKLGRRAANRRYTYGYGRAEDLAGLFIILMILLSAVLVIWESVDRLLNPRPLSHLGVLFGAGVIGFLGNEAVAIYRVRVGKQIGSAALVADGHHARVDGLTSLAVAVAAVFAWLGAETADPIVGIVVGLIIVRVLWTAARDILARVMDAVDPALVDDIIRDALTVPGVVTVTSCQVRWLGHRLHTDLSIGVDERLTVREGHKVGSRVREHLTSEIRFLSSVLVHADPAPAKHP